MYASYLAIIIDIGVFSAYFDVIEIHPPRIWLEIANELLYKITRIHVWPPFLH